MGHIRGGSEQCECAVRGFEHCAHTGTLRCSLEPTQRRCRVGKNIGGGGETRGESRLRALCAGCVRSAGSRRRGKAAEGRGKVEQVKAEHCKKTVSLVAKPNIHLRFS